MNDPRPLTHRLMARLCLAALHTARSIAELVSPRFCLVCDQRLSHDERGVCARCDITLPRRGDTLTTGDNDITRLFYGIVPIERAAALFVYGSCKELDGIIHAAKYGNRPDIAEECGMMMAHEYARCSFFEGIDMIVPLPLHKNRLRKRGYNQSRLLAEGISTVTGIPIADDAVTRVRDTATQTSMPHDQRTANMRGALALGNAARLNGRHILVVDDLVTTGATMRECCMQIAKAQDVSISVLALARPILSEETFEGII